MKKTLVLITILFAIGVSVVHAQTISTSSSEAVLTITTTPAVSEQTLSKYNITFPISVLGNCTDFASCKAYCDDPTHLDACIAYAKQKGFYKPSTLETNQQQILAAAKTELGCDSIDSCQTFCEDTHNLTVCTQFATKNNLDAGSVDKLNSGELLQNAEKTLGCNSQTTCQSFCNDAANQQKCTDFAKENDLKFEYHPQPSESGEPSVVPGEPSGTPSQQHMPASEPNPQAECISNPHCTWTGNACKCVETSTEDTTPTIKSSQNTSDTTTFTNTSDRDNNPNPFPTVKGITTQRTWFEQILSLFNL